MSLLGLLATTPGTPVDPDPGGGGDIPIVGDTTPYAMPTSAPYNAPTYAITPTPDGTGSAVHPSVLDFGATPWNGRRFWMAVTPYFGENDDLENPCILRSHDGYTWEVPPGLTNPIDPMPAGGYNSDTELAYDSATGLLHCFWRGVEGGGDIIWRSSSSDGVTWSAPANVYTGAGDFYSPAVARNGPQWFMWSINARLSASSVTGPWGSGVGINWIGVPLGTPWHLAVLRGPDSSWWALLQTVADAYRLYAARSTDGINFHVNPTPVLTPSTSGWDNGTYNGIYRSTMTLHEDGTHLRLWYSALAPASSYRVGYTRVPRSFWTSIVT